jgi:hypothetical protein
MKKLLEDSIIDLLCQTQSQIPTAKAMVRQTTPDEASQCARQTSYDKKMQANVLGRQKNAPAPTS